MKTSVASLKTDIADALVYITRCTVANCKCKYMRHLNRTSATPRVPNLDMWRCKRIATSSNSFNAAALATATGFGEFRHIFTACRQNDMNSEKPIRGQALMERFFSSTQSSIFHAELPRLLPETKYCGDPGRLMFSSSNSSGSG